MSINFIHILGILLTLAAIIGVGIYSGTRVHGDNDFSNGGNSTGAAIIAGAILGALVGGQSTIGTAQLAFLYGLSAWWFTLGSGIGCLILMLVYAVPMRKTGKTTLLTIISEDYGHTSEYLGSVLSSIGILISIISNVVSGCALMMTVLKIHMWTAVLITVVLMMIYVIFGGVWGAGMGGVVKLLLLYGVSMLGLIMVLVMTGGLGGLLGQLDATLAGTDLGGLYTLATQADIRHQYMNIFARGFSKDLGSGISLILGVLSTQTYAQPIFSAKDNINARRGALLSACLAPPVGVACMAIGMFMRTHCITTAEIQQLTELGKAVPAGLIEIESTSQVLPAFIMNYMPSLLGGIAIGTLLITVVGGGAGLSLGISSILVENIFVPLTPKKLSGQTKLFLSRATIAAVLAIAAVAAVLCSSTMISDMGFLSMGLRGSVVFIPVTCALFLHRKIAPAVIPASMVLGPLTVIVGHLIGLSFDPLFLGIAANVACCAVGYMIGRRNDQDIAS